MKHATSKYPDAELGKALWKAVKVSEADPGHARIVWQRAFDLVVQRGPSVSFGGGGGGGLMRAHPLDPDMQRRQNALDAAHWILASALSMGTMAADYRENLAARARFFDTGRKHRQPPLEVRPLTARQLEVMQIASECEANLAETARRMGLHRKTVEQHYRAACKKLGIRASTEKPKTDRIPLDRRGQEDIAGQGDGPAALPKVPAHAKRDKRAGVC